MLTCKLNVYHCSSKILPLKMYNLQVHLAEKCIKNVIQTYVEEWTFSCIASWRITPQEQPQVNTPMYGNMQNLQENLMQRDSITCSRSIILESISNIGGDSNRRILPQISLAQMNTINVALIANPMTVVIQFILDPNICTSR